MRVLVRVDASKELGGGHVMRQLALAAALRDAGTSVEFACRNLDGYARGLVAAQGFLCHEVNAYATQEEDAAATERAASKIFDWVVVDHYQLGATWEKLVRNFGRRILVVDDLADRGHDADVLVDQNYYADLGVRYDPLIGKSCESLLGPAYALLRPEFAKVRHGLRPRNGEVRRILVSFGATDPAQQNEIAVRALRTLNLGEVAIDLAAGRPSREMARAMAAADLAFGSGGVSTNERMCVGLPAAIVATSPMQENSARDVDAIGAHVYLGPAACLRADDYARIAARLLDDPARLRAMSEEGMRRVDGQGTQRVVARMLKG